VNGQRILSETNEFGSANGCQSQDCPEFKGVFMRYLGRLTASVGPSTFGYASFAAEAVPFLHQNAEMIWSNSAVIPTHAPIPIDILPEKWNAPAQNTYYQQTQTAGLDALIADINQHIIATPPPPPPPPPPAPAPRAAGCR